LNLIRTAFTFFAPVIPLKVVRRIPLSELTKNAAIYYKFKPEDVIAGALGISTTIGLATFSILFYLNSLIATVISITLGYISFLLLINYLPNKLRVERITISSYTSLILQEFYFILKSTGSIFDALQAIILGNYPYVSEKIKEVSFQTLSGRDPDKLLMDYAHSQPSIAFRHGLIEILSSRMLTEGTLRHLIDLSEFEVRGYFQEFSLQFESQALVFIASGFFLPLVFSFGITMLGLFSSPYVFLIVPLHTILMDLTFHRLTRNEAHLLG